MPPGFRVDCGRTLDRFWPQLTILIKIATAVLLTMWLTSCLIVCAKWAEIIPRHHSSYGAILMQRLCVRVLPQRRRRRAAEGFSRDGADARRLSASIAVTSINV